ncbi:hypothetical protein ACLOJK_018111 [Asimina triloba]
MAAMVARGSSQISSSISVQEKGSRNKRKFRADPPLLDQNKLPQSQFEFPAYEFSAEKPQQNTSAEQNGVCDLCCSGQYQIDCLRSYLRLSASGGPSDRKELEVEESHYADWNDLTETQLEELVLSNLDTIFKSAIKRIVSFGYSEDVAMRAVLRSGLCYGCKDTVSNIVESTSAFLRNGQEINSCREHFFEDLEQLERYVLAEMVCVLREVRPFLSTGDAMWCLLICDMNVSLACVMHGDPMGGLGSDESAGGSSVSAIQQPKFDAGDSIRSNIGPDIPKTNRQDSSCSASGDNPSVAPEKGSLVSPADPVAHFLAVPGECIPAASLTSVPEEKLGISKKSHLNCSRRESILRQKSIHLEKHYRAYGAKGALKTGKLSNFGGLFLDKNCKSFSEPSTLNVKGSSLKLGRSVGSDTSQPDGNANLSIKVGLDFTPSPQAASSSPSLPVANTELSLSLPSENISSVENMNYSCSGNSFDNISGQWIPHDAQDETLLKLASEVKELQNQMQEWTEWAQQKVMQAARRLSKDKGELKNLRQEKEEVTRLKKEKQTLEENTMKKLSEMENALCKAGGQVERANAAVRRLELENSELTREMEAAKLQAAESAANCQEVSQREKKMLKKFESWEREKVMLQEELATEKRKLSQLQQQVEQAEEQQAQLEAPDVTSAPNIDMAYIYDILFGYSYGIILLARWRQEEKVKEEALTQAKSLRKEKEQIEASAKTKEDMIRLKAEDDLQRYIDDTRRLEKEIAQLRLTTDSSKIAALHWGIDGTCASRLTDGKIIHAIKETHTRYISEMASFQDWGVGDVQRERECVMCLSEEMSVVFLPCAHQVICMNCNDLHQKQGMKDCPSCRTPIQKRVCVRFAIS